VTVPDQNGAGPLKSLGDAHPEWTLLYRRGLSRKKIAELARVKVSAVTAHLTAAKAADPGLKTEHRAATSSATSHGAPGIKRLYQLLAMVEATGRYPSRNAEDKAERELAQWLRRRRRDADAGILNPVIGAGLSVLPDWRRKPREARADEKWQDHLERLAAYLAAGNPWPRTTPGVTGPEKELGGWLRTQRYKFRHGDLSPERSGALDAALPGWPTGRKAAAEPSDGAAD
jgi:Helicase associated domain